MSLRVLVVDDEFLIRWSIAETLGAAGHEVTEAPDGNKALAEAKAKKFDLVITDVNMPGMNGLDLVKSLRALDDFKFTPILVLTTEAGADVKSRGREAGATGWIVKPFSPEVLIQTLRKVLD